MSVLVVGSVAYDSVTTPAGSEAEALGGSATYFSVSASYFAPVSIVAVVGEDFLPEHVKLLQAHGVDTSGLERRAGKSFRWTGVYGAEDVNVRQTLDTQLNVFADFSPSLAIEQRRPDYLFLANIDPELQTRVLSQVDRRPKLVALDTMNFWIEGKPSALKRVINDVDVLFIDESEIRELSGQVNLTKAARYTIGLGPVAVIVKRGEHGVLVFHEDSVFSAPAFPLEHVVDPTGAGDSFAGGFLGYMAAAGDLSNAGFRRGAALGSVMGSFAVESFSLDRLGSVTKSDINDRFRALSRMSAFESLGEGESLPFRAQASHSLAKSGG